MMQVFQQENERFHDSQQKISALRGILNETNAAKEAVKAIGKSKENEKVIVPIGAGVFVFAKTENTKQALLALSGGPAVPKPVSEIEKELDKRLENIEKALDRETSANQAMLSNLNNFAQVMRQADRSRQQQRR